MTNHQLKVTEKFDLLGLTAQQQQVVKGMILKEAEAFTVDDREIGDVDTHKMKIQLTDQVPVQKNYKRIPKPLHKEIKEYVEGLLNRGLDCFIRIQLLFTICSSAQERWNFEVILRLWSP